MTVISNISSSEKYFSSSLPDIIVALGDGNRLRAVINVGDDVVYNELLSGVGGRVELTDLSGLVSPYAYKLLVATLTVSLTERDSTDTSTVGSSATSATVVYCMADFGLSSATSYLNEHFLTILQGRRTTAPGRREYLHYEGTAAAVASVNYSDGSSADISVGAVGGNDRYTTIDVSPSLFAASGKLVTDYVVTAGSRRQAFDVLPTSPDCAPILVFDNAFGVQEMVYCTGTHSVAPKYERKSAYVGGMLRNYRIEETRAFSADSGPLTTAEANWLDELFRSPMIFVVNVYNGSYVVGKEVVITDSESKRSNDWDSLPRFTFTYQYAQRNHNVVDLRREGRIFDNTFDHTFD